MGLILDTSVLIAAEKHRLELTAVFSAHAAEPFFIAAITASELLHGVERAQTALQKRTRSAFVEAVLREVEAIDFDLATARRHAEVWAALETAGRMIGPHDAMIAATALQHGFGVVTLNLTEFRQVSGLRVIDPRGLDRTGTR
jgi:tRNA(fMet)-specific endonuclease VapC